MGIISILFFSVLALRIDTDSPEDFLETMASGNAEVWIENQTTEETSNLMIASDSITSIISSLNSLSINPGASVLVDIEGGYRLIYPSSHWTWRLDGGRIGSVKDTTIIEWKPGGYAWVVIPFFTKEGASIGREQTLCMGVTLTALIVLFGIITLWFVKRKYG